MLNSKHSEGALQVVKRGLSSIVTPMLRALAIVGSYASTQIAKGYRVVLVMVGRNHCGY